MLLSVTTAGFDRTTICWEQHQYAERVIADPSIDPSFYGCIYSGGKGNPFKEATWKKANPSLGHTVSLQSFAADAKEAENSPQKISSFKRYRLNVWTESATSFFIPRKWMSCVQPHKDFAGRTAYAGLDLSSTTDLSALAVVVADPDDDSCDVFWRIWCPADAIEKRSVRDKVDYVGWARDGFIKPTDGDAIDYQTIQSDILSLFDEMAKQDCPIKLLGVDPWNATMLSQNLAAENVSVCNIRQGYGTLSPATKLTETRVLNGRLRIDDNKAAHAAAFAVSVQSDHQGNIKPSKQKSTQRIDPIAALVNAIACEQSDTAEPDPDWNIYSI